MIRSKLGGRVWPLCALAASIALVGGVATASIPSPAWVFTGCVNKTSGAVRISTSRPVTSARGRRRTVAWSKGYRYRGEWARATSYAALDVVTFNGASYVASARSTGERPSANPDIGDCSRRAARGDRKDPGVPKGCRDRRGSRGRRARRGSRR